MGICRNVLLASLVVLAALVNICHAATILTANDFASLDGHPNLAQDAMQFATAMHTRDYWLGDVFNDLHNTPDLSSQQAQNLLHRAGNTLLAPYKLKPADYLRMGLLRSDKLVDMMQEIATINMEGGWDTVQEDISESDKKWFEHYDQNVSAIYGVALAGCENWASGAEYDFLTFYEDVKQNITIFTNTLDAMMEQYQYGLHLHYEHGTAHGLKDGEGPTDTFALVMNILNFCFNLINLVGLVTFLIIKRRVGASAVLDTEMTFPSSPTAQI